MTTELTTSHDPENSRYIVEANGEVAGYTEYHLRGSGIYFFYHTQIEAAFEGKGLGSKLVRFAIEDVRASGGSVVPLCPFVAAWLERHPDQQDVINWPIMERMQASEG